MKKNIPGTAARVFALLFLASASCALAQDYKPVHATGLINDFSPTNVKGGPWEMHGEWSMDVSVERGVADFSADMTMSDYGTTSSGSVDATQAGQNAHTHHIRLTNVAIIWNMTGCPGFSPATTDGLQIRGTVSLVTGNGGPAPFETKPPTSTLQVCVTGGVDVPFSNLSMVFGGPATTHFGPQAIHGVVHNVSIHPPGASR
jgi:hypothetical protein